MSPDSMEYLDPETLDGLNLYSYCNNNPVMYTDELGNMPNWLKWLLGGLLFVGAFVLTLMTGGALSPLLIGICVGILADGVIEGLISVSNDGSFDDGFWNGAADGALWGGVFSLGSAVIRLIKILHKGVVIGENMKRVGSAARKIGAATYRAPGNTLAKIFGGKNAQNIIYNQNRRWIQRMMKWGVKITDIGMVGTFSQFYELEAKLTKLYWNLFIPLLG